MFQRGKGSPLVRPDGFQNPRGASAHSSFRCYCALVFARVPGIFVCASSRCYLNNETSNESSRQSENRRKGGWGERTDDLLVVAASVIPHVVLLIIRHGSET